MSAFVGRGAELAEIERSLADLVIGRGRILVLSGPAGIGKSRLAEAASARAHQLDVPVHTGYAVDDPGAPALWPWRRAMRRWADAPALPTADVGESDAAARFRLFMAISDLLREHATAAGLLVVLEDMHWADRMSVLLLRHMAAEVADVPIMFVVTCREGVAGPLQEELPHLVRGDTVRPIILAGLSAAEVLAWQPQLSGTSDPSVADALHRSTGGNPLLIRLVAEDLLRRGTVADPSTLAQLMHTRPQLRRLVAARAAVLEPMVREAVDAAAVLGERVLPGVLAALVGETEHEVHALLSAAQAAGVLRGEDVARGLQFEHALVRDAVYAELDPERRRSLHRRAAAALEQISPEAAGSIAHHWQRAGGPNASDRCRAWAERADDAARAVLAFDDAARFARLAVTSAQEVGAEDAELARLYIRLAEALCLGNYLADSIRACVAAADLAEAADRPDLLAQAGLVVHGMGDPYTNRTIPALCERALAVVPADDHVTRARLQAQVAVGVAESEGGTRAADLAAAALAEAERSGDAQAILEAVAARHLAISIPHSVEERLSLGRRAVELGAAAQQPIAALWGHLWRVDAALQLGNAVEVDRGLAAIDRIARERGSALARWHHHRFGAVRCELVGDFAAARAADDAALDLALRVGDFSMMGMHYAFRVQFAWLRGTAEEVPPDFRELMTYAPTMPLVRVSVPLVHAIAGDLDTARAEFEEFRHLPRSYPVGVRWAGTVGQIGMVAILLDDAQVCATIYDLFAPIAHYFGGDGSGGIFSHGANARFCGDLARVAGDHESAIRQYHDGIAMNARFGARPYTALSRLGLAQSLAALGLSHDRQTRQPTAELVEQAGAEFRRLDMPGHLASANALAARLRTSSGATPLSPREAEVAGLVADGLPNKAIAARLFLSERTVETHVRSILGKLGFTTRTEVAGWVLRGSAR